MSKAALQESVWWAPGVHRPQPSQKFGHMPLVIGQLLSRNQVLHIDQGESSLISNNVQSNVHKKYFPDNAPTVNYDHANNTRN